MLQFVFEQVYTIDVEYAYIEWKIGFLYYPLFYCLQIFPLHTIYSFLFKEKREKSMSL